MVIRTIGCLVLLLALSSLPTHLPAEEVQPFSAGDLRDACQILVMAARGVQETSSDDPGAMLCFGYLAGWSQAMEVLGEDRGEAAGPGPYCVPENRQLSPPDVAELFLAYVELDPNRASLSAHQALLQSLQEAFPCPAQTGSEPE
jgi:hypothetical protein